MLVAVADVAIFLATGQQRVIGQVLKADGLLRAVVDAGEAELAVAFGGYAPGGQLVVTPGAHFDARGATYARAGVDVEILLAAQQETLFGVDARTGQKAFVLLAFFVGEGFVPAAACADVGPYSRRGIRPGG